jgi:geranylgeranyl pyrophosphate synthase
VLGHESRVLETFFDVWDKSLKGEIQDIESRKDVPALLESKEELYLDVIINKPDSLFAGAAKIAS